VDNDYSHVDNNGNTDDDDYSSSQQALRKKVRVPRAKPRGGSSSHRNQSSINVRESGSLSGKNFGDGSSAVFGEFDKGSGLNMPLLDYSEGTASNDERSSK